MHSLRPYQAYSFRFWFSQQLRSTLLLKMHFQAQLWQKLAFSSPSFYFNYLSSISSFRRHVMLFSSTHLIVLSGSCSFVLIHLTGVLCPSFKFCHLIKFCPPSQPECHLKSFLPLVP